MRFDERRTFAKSGWIEANELDESIVKIGIFQISMECEHDTVNLRLKGSRMKHDREFVRMISLKLVTS